ncbi:RM17 protein, partial [Chroicocephalus maculipennis]|nr:RM17 protein [Chroicocephalus maculipennis]
SSQLIDYAKLGDTNKHTLHMVVFWLTVSILLAPLSLPHGPSAGAESAVPQKKDLIHKLFKVLASQFQPHSGSYTCLLQIPNWDGLDHAKMSVIELKGKPFLSLICPCHDTEKMLFNQLLMGYCGGHAAGC